ncbi:MAG: 3-deoxy-D-manno-octulosonic acid transferase [Planctomycetota bacterium]
MLRPKRLTILFDALYLAGLLLLAPLLLYRSLTTGKYRRGLAQRLGRIPRRPGCRPCVWFHSVSVGEFLAVESLVRRFRDAHPDFDVLLSATTRTGFDLASSRTGGPPVIYFPCDLSWAVRRAFDAVRPSLVVLVELELWPNFLAEARSRRIPVLLANGRISDKSARSYRRFAFAFRHAFDAVSLWGVQNEEYRRRLLDLGIPPERIVVAGNTKYDSLPDLRDDSLGPALRAELNLAPDDLLLIAGSTFSGEEEILLDLFQDLHPRFSKLRLLLAPRHPERFDEVKEVLRSRRVRWAARTSLPQPEPADVILLDTIGELAKIYACGDVVFVGKSLCGGGGQNILEPAAHGKPVLFGPRVENFRQSADLLLARDAAVEVADKDALRRRVEELLLKPEMRRRIGDNARRVLQTQKGATERYLAMIESLLNVPRKEPPRE